MSNKTLTILVVLLTCIVVVLSTIIFNQDALNGSTTTTSSTTSHTTTTTTTRKKINAYTEIYEWLMENGTSNASHTTVSYVCSYADGILQVNYSTNFPNSINFYMYFPDHNGNSLTFTYYFDKEDTDNTVSYWVQLSSNTTKAYSKNHYEINKATFTRNALVDPNGFLSSYNVRKVPAYTDKEKEEGYKLKEEVDTIHYECLITFLDCLKYDFCPRLGIEIGDMGFLQYE